MKCFKCGHNFDFPVCKNCGFDLSRQKISVLWKLDSSVLTALRRTSQSREEKISKTSSAESTASRSISLLQTPEGVYSGEVLAGQRHGYGTQYDKNGKVVYRGYWEYGRRSGFGILYSSEGNPVFYGNFKENLRDGIGCDVQKDGSGIRSEWHSGERVLRKGSRFEFVPAWSPEMKEVHKSVENKEETYVGEMVNGKRHGYGIQYDGGMPSYIGNWKDDKRSGHGRIFHKNGDCQYYGEFSEGLRDGWGEELNQLGIPAYSYWRSGVRQPEVRNPIPWPRKGISEFAGGSGTCIDPYLIQTKEHLNNVRNHLGASFKLMADITFTKEDFGGTGEFYNSGAGWIPIGSADKPFFGVFDGNSHLIKNLHINIVSSSTVYAGLFGYSNGVVEDLGMVDCEILVKTTLPSVNVFAGWIVGYNYYGTVRKCYHLQGAASNSLRGIREVGHDYRAMVTK